MRLRVAVRADPNTSERPAAGSDVLIEVRDTSLADAPSVLVATGHGRISADADPMMVEVELDVNDALIDPRAQLSVSAQSTSDNTGVRSPGDWITTESYPVRLAGPDIDSYAEVILRRIR